MSDITNDIGDTIEEYRYSDALKDLMSLNPNTLTKEQSNELLYALVTAAIDSDVTPKDKLLINNIFNELLKQGVDVNDNSLNWDKHTALHRIIASNNNILITELLKAGANIHIKNKGGYTPLSMVTEMITGEGAYGSGSTKELRDEYREMYKGILLQAKHQHSKRLHSKGMLGMLTDPAKYITTFLSDKKGKSLKGGSRRRIHSRRRAHGKKRVTHRRRTVSRNM